MGRSDRFVSWLRSAPSVRHRERVKEFVMLGFPTVAIRLLLKSAPQPLKFPNLASKCIDVISCHTIGVHPRFLCITCNFEQLTDFVEGEAKLTAVPNESQTSDEGVVVFAKPIAGPGGSGQQSHLLVVANRFDTGAGESAQHAYGIGDGHDKSDSLPRAHFPKGYSSS